MTFMDILAHRLLHTILSYFLYSAASSSIKVNPFLITTSPLVYIIKIVTLFQNKRNNLIINCFMVVNLFILTYIFYINGNNIFEGYYEKITKGYL